MPAHDAPSPVLVLVPGIVGDPGDGGEALRVVDERDAQLRVTDLGVTRGEGVFETIGVFGGRAVNMQPHLRRLQRSADMIELLRACDTDQLDLDLLEQAVQRAVEEHDDVPELTVRIIVTAGDEADTRPFAWVHARAVDDWSQARRGLRVATLDRGLPSTVTATSPWLLAGAKTISYAVNMAAGREAARRGADDVLFTTSDGYCLEGPTSTLLVRRGNEFVTTPPEAGVLPGTSVASLFTDRTAAGASCREALLTPQEVLEADGAWLLSSVRLAAPITHLDGTELPVDRALTDHFNEVLRGR